MFQSAYPNTILDQKRSNPLGRYEFVGYIDWPDGSRTKHYRRTKRKG